jgi:hypothetical protein
MYFDQKRADAKRKEIILKNKETDKPSSKTFTISLSEDS